MTNIPTDVTKTYTFSVAYYQTGSNRFYISSCTFTDTSSGSILSGAPLFNGGTPSLTGSTACLIIQQFTVLGSSGTFGGGRKVVSTVSCFQ